MSEVHYSAEANNFVEAAPAATPASRAFKSAKVSKTPRISRAEKEDSRAEAAQRWRVADAMRKAASGDYVVHGFSYFTKEAVAELKEMGLRFATEADKNADSMYMQNVDGHLREVRVCALKKPAAKAAKIAAAREVRAEPPQILLASAGIPADQGQNPARATIAPRPSATAPAAHPA